MKYLYKYPQAAYPYDQLLEENLRRTKLDDEYELVDTGVFRDAVCLAESECRYTRRGGTGRFETGPLRARLHQRRQSQPSRNAREEPAGIPTGSQTCSDQDNAAPRLFLPVALRASLFTSASNGNARAADRPGHRHPISVAAAISFW